MSSNVWFRPLFVVGSAVSAVAFVFACSSTKSSNNGSGGNGSGSGSGSSSGSSSFPPSSTEYVAPDGDISPLESPGTCSGATGGSVVGPQDDHCDLPDGGQIIQPTTAAGCTSNVGPDSGGGDGGGDSGDPCPGDQNAYGAVMFNNWGSDDDCKYDVSWQSTPICENQPVYFTVVVTKRTDGSPLLGVETGGTFVPANPRPDVVLNCTHPIPNTPTPRDPSPAVAPGTYVVGPIVFDQPGDWVFRFHFNEECLDVADDSPHGHAAFHIQVP
jgi:hypothetical protein